jgi:PAS domain S-box-containing protein
MGDLDRVSITGKVAREVLDSLVEGCQLIASDFSCVYVNNSFVAQVRRPREQLLGRSMMDCYPGIQKTNILSVLRRSMSERTHQETEGDFVFPDGSRRCFDLRFVPVPEGVCILSLDVTDRKKTEESLRQLEAQFALLYDSVADPIFLLSAELGGGFRFVSVNRAFLTATGLRFDQVVRRRVEEVLPEPSQAVVLPKYHQAIVERRRVTWEEVAVYPAGTKVAEVTVAPLFEETEQRCTHLIGSIHDMTEQKQAEQALKKSEREFRAIFDQAPLGIADFVSAQKKLF